MAFRHLDNVKKKLPSISYNISNRLINSGDTRRRINPVYFHVFFRRINAINIFDS